MDSLTGADGLRWDNSAYGLCSTIRMPAGFKALNTGSSSYGKLDERIYTELTSDHPIDLCRYQVANCYMGRAGLINSGGESKGAGALWRMTGG